MFFYAKMGENCKKLPFFIIDMMISLDHAAFFAYNSEVLIPFCRPAVNE